jgi:hypothetical protein
MLQHGIDVRREQAEKRSTVDLTSERPHEHSARCGLRLLHGSDLRKLQRVPTEPIFRSLWFGQIEQLANR